MPVTRTLLKSTPKIIRICSLVNRGNVSGLWRQWNGSRKVHATVEPPRYVSASLVKEVLKYEDLIPAIEEALVNFSARESGGIVQPLRSAVQIEDCG